MGSDQILEPQPCQQIATDLLAEDVLGHRIQGSGPAASLCEPGSQGGAEDYYAVVSVDGFMKDKKIYGIDPIQSFQLGLKLIEQLTEDKRIGDDDDASVTPGASWRIEIVED